MTDRTKIWSATVTPWVKKDAKDKLKVKSKKGGKGRKGRKAERKVTGSVGTTYG